MQIFPSTLESVHSINISVTTTKILLNIVYYYFYYYDAVTWPFAAISRDGEINGPRGRRPRGRPWQEWSEKRVQAERRLITLDRDNSGYSAIDRSSWKALPFSPALFTITIRAFERRCRARTFSNSTWSLNHGYKQKNSNFNQSVRKRISTLNGHLLSRGLCLKSHR